MTKSQSVQKRVEDFFSHYKLTTFKKGSLIPLSAKISDVYFIQKGLVRMYAVSKNGEEITLHIFSPGSYFPIMLFLSSKLNTYYFEAIKPVEARQAKAEKVISFLKENSEVLFDLTIRFSNALCGLLDRTESLISQRSQVKIILFILYLTKHFGKKEKKEIVIDQKFTHQDIANWVGTSRETVSRCLETLQKSSIISYSNHRIVINDIEKLKKEI